MRIVNINHIKSEQRVPVRVSYATPMTAQDKLQVYGLMIASTILAIALIIGEYAL